MDPIPEPPAPGESRESVARRLDQAPTQALVGILARGAMPGPMSSTWQTLTCLEAEAVAALMRRHGYHDAADVVVAEHAATDEADDLHTAA